MRVYVSMTIDKKVKEVIDQMYPSWFQEHINKDRRASPMKYSKSRFIERLISIGIAFSKIDDDVLRLIQEAYKKEINSGKKTSFPEFVKRLLLKGLEVEKWLPG